FIHCHPHLSILDLFLIRQMVPFSLPRFAKNIDSTYIVLTVLCLPIFIYFQFFVKPLNPLEKIIFGGSIGVGIASLIKIFSRN
ncbi:hypothetical protein M5W66_22115, partial [Paenibacillus larvae]